MLVLDRRQGERIFIGDEIVITLVRTNGGTAKIGIEAPKGVMIDREEIRERRKRDAEKTLETGG